MGVVQANIASSINLLKNNMADLPGSSYTFTDIPDFVKVGNYCSIAEGVKFHPLREEHLCVINRKCVYTTNWDQPRETGQITIGNDVWICKDVRILSNVKIGNGAIIGAGSVVAKDVPPFAVVVGNPARIAHYRFTPDVIAELEKIAWWDKEQEWISEKKDDMKDVDKFIEKYKVL